MRSARSQRRVPSQRLAAEALLEGVSLLLRRLDAASFAASGLLGAAAADGTAALQESGVQQREERGIEGEDAAVFAASDERGEDLRRGRGSSRPLQVLDIDLHLDD